MKVYKPGAAGMPEESDKKKELAKPQVAPETVFYSGVIKNQSLQKDWRETQKQHMLGQDQSATDLFCKPGAANEASQKFELFEGSQEPALLASNVAPGAASVETIPQVQAASSEVDAVIARDFKQDYCGFRNLGLGSDVVRVTSPGSDRLIFPYRGTEDIRLAECTKANPAAWNEAFQAFPELGKYLSAEAASKLMRALVRNELHNYDVKDSMGDNRSEHGYVNPCETLGYAQIAPIGVVTFCAKYPQLRKFLNEQGHLGPNAEATALLDPACLPMIMAAKLQSEVDDFKHVQDKMLPGKCVEINARSLAYAYNADVYYNPKTPENPDLHANIIPKAKEIEHLRGYEKAYPTSDERVLIKSEHLKNVERQLQFLH